MGRVLVEDVKMGLARGEVGRAEVCFFLERGVVPHVRICVGAQVTVDSTATLFNGHS